MAANLDLCRLEWEWVTDKTLCLRLEPVGAELAEIDCDHDVCYLHLTDDCFSVDGDDDAQIEIAKARAEREVLATLRRVEVRR